MHCFVCSAEQAWYGVSPVPTLSSLTKQGLQIPFITLFPLQAVNKPL